MEGGKKKKKKKKLPWRNGNGGLAGFSDLLIPFFLLSFHLLLSHFSSFLVFVIEPAQNNVVAQPNFCISLYSNGSLDP